jgi:hypothetical protein
MVFAVNRFGIFLTFFMKIARRIEQTRINNYTV